MVQSEIVNVGQQAVAYRTSTGAGRPVVFLHGNSSSGRTWQQILDGAIGHRFRCLVLDLPGHGRSPALADASGYSLPGYAAALTGFVEALDLHGAVFVGWSLGGNVILEAAPSLPDPAGVMIFGAPPVGSPAAMGEAFLPNPAMNHGFTAELSADDALAFATTFFAAGSSASLQDTVADILATDGAARLGLLASIGEARFADEVSIVKALRVPIAILHGREDQLVNLAYIQNLSVPTLWREKVQVLDRAGHALQEEQPEKLSTLLEQFIDELA